MKRYPLVFCCLIPLMACTCTSAQPVYRCGNSYSQTPCGPDARPIQTDDARSEAQRAAAQAGAARDKALADAMEAQRQRDEAMVRGSSPLQAHTKPARRSAKVQQPGVFTARGPGDPKKAKTKSKTKTSSP